MFKLKMLFRSSTVAMINDSQLSYSHKHSASEEWNSWNGIKHMETTCLTLFHLFYSSHYNDPVLL
jgi:hypothetical protein